MAIKGPFCRLPPPHLQACFPSSPPPPPPPKIKQPTCIFTGHHPVGLLSSLPNSARAKANPPCPYPATIKKKKKIVLCIVSVLFCLVNNFMIWKRKKKEEKKKRNFWWWWQDSNPESTDYETRELPLSYRNQLQRQLLQNMYLYLIWRSDHTTFDLCNPTIPILIKKNLIKCIYKVVNVSKSQYYEFRHNIMNLRNQNSKYSWRIRDLENPQTGTQFANSVLMYKILLDTEISRSYIQKHTHNIVTLLLTSSNKVFDLFLFAIYLICTKKDFHRVRSSCKLHREWKRVGAGAISCRHMIARIDFGVWDPKSEPYPLNYYNLWPPCVCVWQV